MTEYVARVRVYLGRYGKQCEGSKHILPEVVKYCENLQTEYPARLK